VEDCVALNGDIIFIIDSRSHCLQEIFLFFFQSTCAHVVHSDETTQTSTQKAQAELENN